MTASPGFTATVNRLTQGANSAKASEDAARKTLTQADFINDQGCVPSAGTLLDAVYQLAGAEAARQMWQTAWNIATGPRPEGRTGWLIEVSITKPDDQWSGRRNDMKRVVYERQMDTLRAIRSAIRFGGEPASFGYPEES